MVFGDDTKIVADIQVNKHDTEARKGRKVRASASRNTHAVVYDLLRSVLSSGVVLDIPSGTGAFERYLAESPFEAVCADIQDLGVIEPEKFRRADMNERLPFDDGVFDAVVSIEGIEHIERPFDFIRECRRVLTSGGYLFLTTPNISALRSRWRWFLTGFHNKCKYPLDEKHPAARHHINMLSFPELRYMLHTNGFRIERIATNRIKAASWLYLPLSPLQYLVSRMVFRRGIKNPEHGRITGETIRQMMSKPVLFGESLILVARVSENVHRLDGPESNRPVC
ncbi:MAG: class I SAM-dependent methyltransferase [Candidatus Hydrogenedentota bacterium]